MAIVGASIALLALATAGVNAQPSPDVQAAILASIKSQGLTQKNGSAVDWTAFVNPFIGTDNYGDVHPGASIPFGMAKFSTDMTGYAPAGYITDPTQEIRGISPLHDSGTGSSSGSYGNFEVMPSICSGGFYSCITNLNNRLKYRKSYTDYAHPGYFGQTLENDIKIEATSTRRGGIERFTFPAGVKPYFVMDLSNDLPASFGGGVMDIFPDNGTIQFGGQWKPSFGPGYFWYQAYSCYSLLDNGNQKLDEYGAFTSDNYGMDTKEMGLTHLNLSVNLIGSSPYQAGAVVSILPTDYDTSKETTVTLRVGVSFVSAGQACANLNEEIGTYSFEDVEAASKALWNEKLGKVEIDIANTHPNVTELLYSSIYRSFLTPNNATGETNGLFAGTTSPYFDSLYCSWEYFRTFYPWMSLHSPKDYAEIVENYIDGWRKNGWLPECRSNQLPGWTQGGSDGTNILADFAVKYHNEAAGLGVDINELYNALKSDGEINPPEWNIEGRQVNVYKQYGYVPYTVLDPSSTGRQTREGSRTLEYSFNDFAIRQVAQLLGQSADEQEYTNRSYWYRNVWDSSVTSDGFTAGFAQKRLPNGTFSYQDPINCSPADTSTTRECSLTQGNVNGFYESSSWEYSFFAPHDTAHLIDIMGGPTKFMSRLDHFFNEGYYLAGNEPSFQTPLGYHYAGSPGKSVQRVRQVVAENFNTSPAGLPGNDDQAAMATLLIFHLLGLYPVPSTTQYLVVSPFLPTYTIHNSVLNVSTTVTVAGFDQASVTAAVDGSGTGTIPTGARAYVVNATLDGVPFESTCHFDFYDVFRKGGQLVLGVSANATVGCLGTGGSLPMSLSTGGFAQAR
ncbi:glycoside hydrolase family 92 protein [Clavulina sp. PMI_390]|nr:glycoside hydrolase family 92 protein [Clavulina sp. PMI_390]